MMTRAAAARRSSTAPPASTSTGRNAEQREAQLHEETIGDRLAAERAEVEAGRERRYLELARHEFAAYRSVARLIGGEERLAA
jgi:hypothetical protein